MNDVVCPSCGHSWPSGTAFCGACANTIPDILATLVSRPLAVVAATQPPAMPAANLSSPVESNLPSGTEHPNANTRRGPIPERSDVIVIPHSPEVQLPKAVREDQLVPRKMILALVGTVAVCALGVGSLSVYAAVASAGSRPHVALDKPAATPSAGSDLTVPSWWKPTPVWSAKATGLAVTSDGKYVAVSDPAGVEIRAADTGKVVDSIKEPGLRVAAITSGGERGLLAWTTAAVRVWTPKEGTSAPIKLTGDQSADVKGDGSPLVTIGSNEIAWAVTANGLVAYSSPSKGAVPVAIVSGGVAWASARQAVLIARPDGTVTSTITLAPPHSAMKISRWVGVAGGQMLVMWTDGARQILTGTTLTGGPSLAPTQLDPSDAAAAFVPSGDTRSGMLGALLLHLDSDLAPAPTPGFSAAAAVGGLFLGQADARTALIRPNGAKVAVPSGVTPIGVTRGGGLLASTAAGIELFAAN